MLFDAMNLHDIYCMIYYLTGDVDRLAIKEQLISSVKHKTNLSRTGQISSYSFDEHSLWKDFFLRDETLRNRMDNYRIASIDELKMRTWDYVEKNRGSIPGNLFPSKMK